MASACVNKAVVGVSPEGFLDGLPPYGWLSPRVSFSRDVPDEDQMISGKKAVMSPPVEKKDLLAESPAAGLDLIDFEFRLEDPVAMLPADELFSDGKLVPLRLANASVNDHARHSAARSGDLTVQSRCSSRAEVGRSSEAAAAAAKARRLREAMEVDPLVFSPKAPRCSSRWRELLGLKRSSHPRPELQKSASAPSKSSNPRPLRHFLHRSSKSTSAASDPSLNLPLLRDLEAESGSISSSRFSLSSSSSSGPDHEELPRLSLDTDNKPPNHQPAPIPICRNPPRVRVVARARHGAGPEKPVPAAAARVGRSPMRRVPEAGGMPARGASVDSPRMNSSGKVVFQSLERSSSSPSAFVGGSKVSKTRGMERSYSANVRVRPVLNVPVCSLRGSSKSGSVFGLGQLFLSQRKEALSKGQPRGRTADRS